MRNLIKEGELKGYRIGSYAWHRTPRAWRTKSLPLPAPAEELDRTVAKPTRRSSGKQIQRMVEYADPPQEGTGGPRALIGRWRLAAGRSELAA
jgi:hypothetical protein